MVIRRGAAALLVASACLYSAGSAGAHDAHVESDPPSGSQIDEPITQVHLEFDERIGDNPEIVVLDPNDDQLESETTLVSETAAVVTFDEIDLEGGYIVRYVATSIRDGHLLLGAVSFTYGSPASSGPSAIAWILMCLGAMLILATGAFFSYRRYRQLSSDSEVDEDLADVGV